MEHIQAIVYFRGGTNIPVELLIQDNEDIVMQESCFIINSIHGVHVYPMNVIFKIVTNKREG